MDAINDLSKKSNNSRSGTLVERGVGALVICFYIFLSLYVLYTANFNQLDKTLPAVLLALVSLVGNTILWCASLSFFIRASKHDKDNNSSIVARHLNSHSRGVFIGIAILNGILFSGMLFGLIDHEKFRSIVPGVVGAFSWAYIYTSWQMFKSNRYMFPSYGKVTAALFLVFVFAALHFAITVFIGTPTTRYFLLFTLGALLCILGGSAGLGAQLFYFLIRDGNILDSVKEQVGKKFPDKESEVVLQRLGDYGLYSEKLIKDEGLLNIKYILYTSTDCGIQEIDCESLFNWAADCAKKD